jgi:hypothetical protein
MRLEPSPHPKTRLHPLPLRSYNRPAAGVPARLSSAPGHVRGPARGPMLLNSRGPILLKTDIVGCVGRVVWRTTPKCCGN